MTFNPQDYCTHVSANVTYTQPIAFGGFVATCQDCNKVGPPRMTKHTSWRALLTKKPKTKPLPR